MDQTVTRESSGERRALLPHALGLFRRDPVGVELIERHAAHETHGHDVSTTPDGPRGGISVVVQRGHEGILLRGRRAGEEQPRVGQVAIRRSAPPAVLRRGVYGEVIALLLDVAEGRAAETMELEHYLGIPRRDGEVHVRLLPRAYPVPDPADDAASLEIVQRQDVVSGIRQSVSVVAAALIVTQQLVAQQGRHDLVRPAVSEVRYGVYQGEGNELAIFHAGFDCVQDAEVLTVHRAHHGRIELHGRFAWLGSFDIIMVTKFASARASARRLPYLSPTMDFGRPMIQTPGIVARSNIRLVPITHLGDDDLDRRSFNDLNFVYATPGDIFSNRNGHFHHDDFIGMPYGCKIRSRSAEGLGFLYLLRPTPELWARSLPHRTQIVHELDSSMIIHYLDIGPNMIVCESGTGSGAMSHAILRSIAPGGMLHTYEFNGVRAERARLCSYSPCVEQTQRTVSSLRDHGFHSIRTVEARLREYFVSEVELEDPTCDYLPEVLTEERASLERERCANGGTVPPTPTTTTTPTPTIEGGNDVVAAGNYRRKAKKKMLCARPFAQMRGHTAFLTFATAGNAPRPDPNEGAAKGLKL
ncbi:hypothetical protein ACHAW5_006771 [Stephanodiscus triporus]|uniref:tRNA (adenine(58)-N(1))-methyltransferase n=1 Tax=Stephanodiscus triporus TaxID=2934178 RepID=A0ABD3NNF3_9STRA